ncbi:MAG TPA: flavin reductase family protein, partial [Actinomycetota bacterium]|nr:flavin reductase family protein [Actinomycetota bacterium]
TVVTVAESSSQHGMTASAFASVSLEPPRVLVCLDKASRTNELLASLKKFAVNILAMGQEDIARAFARTGEKPFAEAGFVTGVTGAALLEGTLGWIECSLFDRIDAGDHHIVIGDVLACEARSGEPLVYFSRDYRSLKET